MFVIKNKKGEQQQKTAPVVGSVRFMTKLFELEEQFGISDVFFKRKSGHGRLIYHVTKADIQLAMTLQVGFNTKGVLEDANRYQVYNKLKDLYEDPVCVEQFYQAFSKFLETGLISCTADTYSRAFTLQHYLEPETEEIGRFVLYHPIVFSKAFTDLPVAAQRWFLYACLQQGAQSDKLLQRNWHNIMPLVHARSKYQMEQLLVHMRTPLLDGQALFNIGRIERNAIGGKKVVYQVNAALIPVYEPELEYHDIIVVKNRYRPLQRFLRQLLVDTRLTELENVQEGRFFRQLLQVAKGKSKSYIRVVITYIKEMYQQHRYLPEDLMDYIRKDLRDQVTGQVLGILQQTGVYPFLAPSGTTQQERIPQLVSKIRGLPLNMLRRACRAALPTLKELYSKPAALGTIDYVRGSGCSAEIEHRLELHSSRQMAFTLQKDPSSYMALEASVVSCYKQHALTGQDLYHLQNWFRSEIRDLDQWRPVADAPTDFRLEEFLLSYLA